jgi:hypothetical protein
VGEEIKKIFRRSLVNALFCQVFSRFFPLVFCLVLAMYIGSLFIDKTRQDTLSRQAEAKEGKKRERE